MKNTTKQAERVTVGEMTENVLAMLKTCCEGNAERVGDRICIRLEGGEVFWLSVMGVV